MKLIDRFLPSYDFREMHSISMRCSRREALDAIEDLSLSELPRSAAALIWIRGIPERLAGKPAPPLDPTEPIIRQVTASGFLVSDEGKDSELAAGLVGQYWKSRGGSSLVRSGEDFVAFERLDHTMVAANFVVADDPAHASVKVTTETRVYTPGIAARRKFALYWLFARPASSFIKRAALRALKRRAEGERS